MSGIQFDSLRPDVIAFLNELLQRVRELEALTMRRNTTSVPIAVSASGATTLVAAVASRRIKVISMSLLANAAVNVKMADTTPADLTGLHYLPAKGGWVWPDHEDDCWVETAVGKGLAINLSAAVAVGGVLTYLTGP